MFRLEILPQVRDVIRTYPPVLKREMRHAFDKIRLNPRIGEPLRWKLKGFYKYRIHKYRIIYEIVSDDRLIRIRATGQRRDIYESFNP